VLGGGGRSDGVAEAMVDHVRVISASAVARERYYARDSSASKGNIVYNDHGACS
jgi:hypothetical protein